MKITWENKKIVDFCVDVGFLKSKSEVSRLIEQKGLYVNDKLILDKQYELQESDLLHNQYIFLRRGKKMVRLVKLYVYTWKDAGIEYTCWADERTINQFQKEIYEGIVDLVFNKRPKCRI